MVDVTDKPGFSFHVTIDYVDETGAVRESDSSLRALGFETGLARDIAAKIVRDKLGTLFLDLSKAKAGEANWVGKTLQDLAGGGGSKKG